MKRVLEGNHFTGEHHTKECRILQQGRVTIESPNYNADGTLCDPNDGYRKVYSGWKLTYPERNWTSEEEFKNFVMDAIDIYLSNGLSELINAVKE